MSEQPQFTIPGEQPSEKDWVDEALADQREELKNPEMTREEALLVIRNVTAKLPQVRQDELSNVIL